ncbi:MAG: VTT domain-containing protein [Bacteroidota bacterium]
MNKKGLQILFFVIISIIITLFLYYDLQTWLQVENIVLVKNYFLNLGMVAPFYMVIIYILFNLAAIPRVFFTIFSGYIFGLFYGFIFAWLATLAGLIVTFISIRYLFKEKFEQKFGKKEIVERLNMQIEKRGIILVIFLRAIYVVPSSVLNYSFGFTKIKTFTYLLGSAIGFIPVVFINVYAGFEIGQKVNSETNISYLYVSIFITLLVTLYIILKNYVKRIPIFSSKN